MKHRIVCLLLLAAAAPKVLAAQVAAAPEGPSTAPLLGAPTPDSLARLVVARFASASPAAFDSVYPHEPGREIVRGAVQSKAVRRGDVGRVVWTERQRAVLLLAGTVVSGRGSDETNRVRGFSGFYEATSDGQEWRIVRMLPLDTVNYIRSQALHVTLTPGTGLEVLDTLGLTVGGAHGIAMRLNNAVRIEQVQLDGRTVPHAFGGGVLWVSAPDRPGDARLVLRYQLPEDREPAGEGGASVTRENQPAYGARLNTDVWHPFFEYNSANDLAELTITARIPASYRLATSVPQQEVVRDGVRTVTGRSIYPAFLLALIFDREWEQKATQIGDLRFETFLSPDFAISHDTLAAAVRHVFDVLRPRFGEPQPGSHYLAVAESRTLRRASFPVRMNNLVLAGVGAKRLDEALLGPSSNFAHEVSHGWTINASGPAANFLREGWATYAESLILRSRYGAEVERAFWERIRTGYMTASEGRRGILRDPENGGVHYAKGSWILHMLNGVLGDSVFDAGMRGFIRAAGAGSGGYEDFIAAMSDAAGRDMAPFIMPWITDVYIPNLDAQLRGRYVVVNQLQPGQLFDLPLDLALVTASGETVTRPLRVHGRSDSLDVGDLGRIESVRVDPSNRFLLHRYSGEVVRFELFAPGAKSVELAGNFISRPIPATRQGDSWSVELPLSEGRYVWLWRVDGVAPSDEAILSRLAATPAAADRAVLRRSRVLVVRPLERLSAPYPR